MRFTGIEASPSGPVWYLDCEHCHYGMTVPKDSLKVEDEPCPQCGKTSHDVEAA